ncbi:riboflavin kinase-like isoform X2 [Penaeus japonicus]|uniref:riboflavin kinase-like isoform X2 n=1 Tax=Penaeus japonicus TaxID=27405 RepID=UPI001C70C3B4|nr:riboflavin kinase-like isoform X2 [Penaeus japonicus]
MRFSSLQTTAFSIAMAALRRGLPHFAVGCVVKGFGRGSKELGIPTANFPEHVVEKLPEEISTGIYYGWAKVDNGPTLKMVMSIGWNPYYNNKKKSMETHIMHVFENDFYGSELKVVMLGYIRPEENYSSLDELIKAIKNDIAEADRQLSLPEHVVYKDHAFFTGKPVPQTNGSISNGITANGKVNGHGETENQMNGNCNHSG